MNIVGTPRRAVHFEASMVLKTFTAEKVTVGAMVVPETMQQSVPMTQPKQ
jgi:hypothetical protein